MIAGLAFVVGGSGRWEWGGYGGGAENGGRDRGGKNLGCNERRGVGKEQCNSGKGGSAVTLVPKWAEK